MKRCLTNKTAALKHWPWLLLLLTFIALALKLFRPVWYASYNPETAQHYLDIIKFNQGELLVPGPRTSHAWLRLSSFPYYFFYPIFSLSGFHPLTLPFLWTIVSSLTVILNYLVVKHIFGPKPAIISSIFYLISPNLLRFDHLSGFFSFIIPLTYILLFFMHRLLHKRTTKTWPLFMIISVMFTLHASAIMLVPFALGLIWLTEKRPSSHLVPATTAFLIPQLPFLIRDATQGFTSSLHLLAWIPYRILNFLTGTTLDVSQTKTDNQSLSLILGFFRSTLIPDNIPWWGGIIVIGILVASFWYSLKRRHLTGLVIHVLIAYVTLALFIHQNPPHHYFISITTLPLIIMAHTISGFSNTVHKNIILATCIAGLTTLNLTHYLGQFSLKPQKPPIGYRQQLELSQAIHNTANNRPFQLTRYGRFDHYPGRFQENYEYLLLWQGAHLQPAAKLKFLIVEDTQYTLPNNADKVYSSTIAEAYVLR